MLAARPANTSDTKSVEAEALLDELLPDSIDWRHLVRTYPRGCMAAAALAGFWLARRHGDLVLAAVGSYMAAQVSQSVTGLLGE